MVQITDTIINEIDNEHNLFILLKKNMIKGEIRLANLSSKNRSLLHRICYNYGFTHYSTGNYKTRTIVIKDIKHTYFSNDTEQFQFLGRPTPYQTTTDTTTDTTQLDNETVEETNDINTFNFISKLLYSEPVETVSKDETVSEEEVSEEEVSEEEVSEEEVSEEEVSEDDESEDETDTYSSSDSTSSESYSNLLEMQNSYISNQLTSLRIVSYANLIMNIIIICNM